jgi:L-ascorbate metabolism protein UlaG (beta-lactamase superfamily)
MKYTPGAAPFNGTHFGDPRQRKHKKFAAIVKFLWARFSLDWPAAVPVASFDRPPERVKGAQIRASFVNHATVLLQTAGLNILTDPVWSERVSPVSFAGPKRVHPPGIRFNDLPPIDYVLISHNHYDHLDLATLARLYKKHHPLFLVGLKVSSNMRDALPKAKIIELDWQQTHEISDNAAITFLPAQHWSARTLWDRNTTLWGAFAIRSPGGNIYFAGDSGYAEHFKAAGTQFGGFKLALLPIGAYAPRRFMKFAHMNPQEAVHAAADLRAEHSMGIHFGCFPLTLESIDAPEKEIARLAGANFLTLKPGEWRIF